MSGPWTRYEKSLSKTGYGRPVWVPDPRDEYERIEVGDVYRMEYVLIISYCITPDNRSQVEESRIHMQCIQGSECRPRSWG